MMQKMQNNRVELIGQIVRSFEFSHEYYGERFYITMLAVERESGVKDVLPIMVSERLIDTTTDWTGRFVKVSGQYRSYNKHEKSKLKLVLSVFVMEFTDVGEIPFVNNKNYVYLDGYICKPPLYRETPLGRKITDIILGVNRQYGKSDYLPVICWGRNAMFANTLEVSTRLQIEGRIQSREYIKKISDEETETRVAYEVSVSKLEVVEETEE